MKILVINGVNLNMLGVRERNLYGNKTYKDLIKFIKRECNDKPVKLKFYQSNYEGDIVTVIQKAMGKYDGIVINPGAYTHTSLAILDALKSVSIPCAEVHITDVKNREEYRKFSYVSEYAFVTICGKGFDGYVEAIDEIVKKLS